MTSIKKWDKIATSPLDLELGSYDFHLPEAHIATRPKQVRHQSKLLVYQVLSQKISHTSFENIGQFLPGKSTLVLNQSKVFKARLLGKKATGGAAEVFVLSLFAQKGNHNVMIRTTGNKKIGDQFYFENLMAKVTGIEANGTFWVKFNQENLAQILQEQGSMPIPPYIRNGIADEEDEIQYQTVFSQELGSVAAPTAGLHFTEELMQQLENHGHDFARVTLHVGAGTFQPVKTASILDHSMHAEFFSIDQMNAQKIKNAWGNLIPVGTTALRTLQSCVESGEFQAPRPGEFTRTEIFLYPGKEIYGLKGLITNFHLPKSTLLMLVSSLIGREKTLELYDLAIKENYRFFSYGDAMLILNT